MSDLNDLSKPVTTDTEPNVLDTLRGHIIRAITWTGYTSTANKVAGLMSAVTAAVTGGRSLRLYRRNDANTADDEVVSLPGISVGGNAGTASDAQAGSALATALAAKAPLASPAFSGTPTVPTAALGSNSTQIANMAAVAAAVANLVNSAPAALDTINELATAMGNDPNFAASMNAALANRGVKTSANRPGVTKLYQSDADTAYNAQLTWQTDKTGYWSLRGYSADAYHAPVYVGYAGVAGSVVNGVYTDGDQSIGGKKTFTDRIFGNGAVPAGLIAHFGNGSPPAGWLVANGAAVSRTAYADLFAAIGGNFGVGDGSTTFNLPNLVDRMAIGSGSMYGINAQGGSRDAVLVSHAHNYSGTTSWLGDHAHTFSITAGSPGGNGGYAGASVIGNPSTGWAGSHNHTFGGTTDWQGQGPSGANLPPYLGLLPCIKY